MYSLLQLYSSIQFPTIFAEDAAALLGQTSPEFKPLGYFAELHEEQLELCGADVDSGLDQSLLNFGKTFLHENFRKLSMHSVCCKLIRLFPPQCSGIPVPSAFPTRIAATCWTIRASLSRTNWQCCSKWSSGCSKLLCKKLCFPFSAYRLPAMHPGIGIDTEFHPS